jgi:hypothetical protein
VTAVRRVEAASLALVLVGVAAFLVALARGAGLRAWEAFLVNLVFWLGVAQGGVVISASLYLTEARWGGAGLYRLAEAFAGFLPVGWLLFWALVPARATIFPWILHPEPQTAAWLNAPFLFGREGVGLFVMAALSQRFVRASRRAESVHWAESRETIEPPPRAVRRLAPTLIVLYAVVYSVLAFDLVMSLSPRWSSTLFGAYFFSGAYWSGLVAMGGLAAFGRGCVRRDGDRSVLHDLGKLVFAFSVFWAYLLWSQYLPIWYADLPDETFFVVPRVHRLPWGALGWLAFVLVWVVPFTVLMGRRPKQTPAILGTVCALGLVGIWVERYVLIVPSLSPRAIPLGWVEALVTLGFLGVFVLSVAPGVRLVPAPAEVER